MLPYIGMERVRTQLYAFQVEEQAGYQIISDTFNEPEKCGLMELEPFQLPMASIPVKKGFSYRELFRQRWVDVYIFVSFVLVLFYLLFLDFLCGRKSCFMNPQKECWLCFIQKIRNLSQV